MLPRYSLVSQIRPSSLLLLPPPPRFAMSGSCQDCVVFVCSLSLYYQAYSDYQLQPMTSNFIDQFGYKEDEFTEQEGRVE